MTRTGNMGWSVIFCEIGSNLDISSYRRFLVYPLEPAGRQELTSVVPKTYPRTQYKGIVVGQSGTLCSTPSQVRRKYLKDYPFTRETAVSTIGPPTLSVPYLPRSADFSSWYLSRNTSHSTFCPRNGKKFLLSLTAERVERSL